MELRTYQTALVNDIKQAWQDHRCVLGWLPTGGGKTEISVHFAQHETCTLFIVDRKTLANQAHDRYTNKYGMLTGLLRGDDTNLRGYEPAIVASIQTLRARKNHPDVKALLERVTLIVIDEAHIRFSHHDEILQCAPNAKVLGLTATPVRDGLQNTYGHLTRGPSYDELIEQNYLVRCRYFVPSGEDISKALDDIKISNTGDFVSSQLSTLMRQRTLIGDLVSHWQEKAADRQSIAFCTDIAHSQDVCNSFLNVGVAAEHIDHRTPEETRAEIFTRFKSGETKILTSVAVLAIGFDEPVASCAILARPTLSTALHVQQIGRVMRPHDGKTDALILDHAANTLRHGKVESFDPPDLNDIDKRSDHSKRKDKAEYKTCPECQTILAASDRVCSECGHESSRSSVVDFHPAKLRDADLLIDGNNTTDELRDIAKQLYLELRYIHQSAGHDPDKAAKMAYAQIAKTYSFRSPYAWRELNPIPPRESTVRLVTSWRIAWRKRKEKGRQMSNPDKCRKCGSQNTQIGPGNGPHHASLRCSGCNKFIRWIARNSA